MSGVDVLRAVWGDTVLAEANTALFVDGNRYFPPDAVRWEHLVDSPTVSWCWWKGRASYLSIAVDDEVLADAAWYYPTPSRAAKAIKGRVAFWRGVRVE
jgi:uncharacterized protein (DUF427 family)